MEAKKKGKKLTQVHGKTEGPQPTRLDQIMGDFVSRYKTSKLEEYIEDLWDMGKVDLANHSVAQGLIPIDNKEELVNRLIKQFKVYHSTLNKPAPDQRKKKDRFPSPEIQAILSEGR